jgi:peptidoglycan/xylan/chitin deacetylase (PgdA/CDA1 family)
MRSSHHAVVCRALILSPALMLGFVSLSGRAFADAPALEVALGHAPSHFLPGMVAAYVTATVRNAGAAATGGLVTVTALVPAGLKATAAGGAGWSCSVAAATATCTRNDPLAPRASYPLLRIVADVAADVPERVSSSATVTLGSSKSTATDTIPARDACPHGWSPEQTVAFAPPVSPGRPGGIDSGVRNPQQADGCTLLDAIWDAEPFDSHQRFVDTVERAADDFVRKGLLAASQRRAIAAAARRSEVGRGNHRATDNSCAKRIALKFDDGPSSFRPQLLQVLRDKQVHATFFDNGVRVLANPQVSRFQVREGHIQLSHTHLHVHMDQLPAEAVRDETLRAEAALASAGAPMTFKGLRPPFGGTNATVSRVLLELGYTEFRSGLQVGAEDWLPERTAAAIRDDIIRQLRPGLIIGLHDGPIDTPAGAATVEAVRQSIDRARELGYCFGVVDDTAQVVADRYVPSAQAIPRTTHPVPYRLPLVAGAPEQLPRPFVRIPSPIQIAARHAPATFVRGQAGTLTLTITNDGDRPTDGAPVNVAAAIPAGLIATAASGEGWACTGAEVRRCTRSDVLAPRAAYPPITITVKVAADAPTSIVHAPTVTGHGSAWADEASDRISTAEQS